MAYFEIPENPIFNDELRQLEPTDRAHASIFNNIIIKLFHNSIFNRKQQQDHVSNKSNPHDTTPAQIGAASTSALDAAYENGNAYTDTKIAALVNGAPSTLDTLKEIADAMVENKSVVDALEESIGSKAPKTEFDSHVASKTIHITAAERTKWNTIDSTLSTTSTNSIQNKAVKDAIDAQNSNFMNSIAELNNSLNDGNLDFDFVANDGLYYNVKVGADTVRKKCSSTVVYLGNGTSFNVSSYPGYKKFTSANFICGAEATASLRYTPTGDTEYSTCTITKSYNSTNGVLTISNTYAQTIAYGNYYAFVNVKPSVYLVY